MGYQNSTFPLAIYGCMDTSSRKLLWLKVWITNSDPQLIGRWYREHLLETKIISAILRVDKGTETGTIAAIHSFLRRHRGDMDPHDTVVYGPSTSNQVCNLPTLHTVLTRTPLHQCIESSPYGSLVQSGSEQYVECSDTFRNLFITANQ